MKEYQEELLEVRITNRVKLKQTIKKFIHEKIYNDLDIDTFKSIHNLI